MFKFGVRSFMIDICEHDKELYLCHGDYTPSRLQQLGKQPRLLKNLFEDINILLTNNNNELITLHLECYASTEKVYDILVESDLDKFLFKKKNPNDRTLTLGEIREENKRLIIFSDYAANRAISGNLTIVSGINPTFLYKETRYSIEDYPGCEMRDDFRADPNDDNIYLFVFNHFSPFSALKNYKYINSYQEVLNRIRICIAENHYPNFIALDYVESGECTGCSSGRNIVFMLNALKNISKIADISSEQIEHSNNMFPIKTYSHVSSFMQYILPQDTWSFVSGIVVGCITATVLPSIFSCAASFYNLMHVLRNHRHIN